MSRLFQRDFQVVAEVGTTIDIGATAPTTTAAPTEYFIEDATEGIPEAATTSSAKTAGLLVDTRMAVLIIGGTFLAIRKNLVSLLAFLEFFLRPRIVRIAVGVVLHGQLAVGLLDLVFTGVAVDAENFINIAL